MLTETANLETDLQTDSQAAIEDLTIEYRWDWQMLIIVAVIGGFIGGATVLMPNLPKVFLIFGLVLLGFGGFWFLIGQKASGVRKALQNLPADPNTCRQKIADVIAGSGNVVTDKHPLRPNFNVLTEVARALYHQGERGRIWRFHAPRAEITNPPPLTVPIEPILLRETSETFQEFAGQRVTRSEKTRQMLKAFINTYGHTRVARWLGYLMLAFILFGLFNAVGDAVLKLLRGEPDSLIDVAIYICVFIVLGIFVRAMWPREWFLVPGALVVRTSSWSRSNWDVHVLPRDECVLIYWGRVRQLVVIGPDNQVFSRQATALEAEQAMRAFLSPLSAPTAEELSDLV